jgi:AraC family transcriptional regulator of adaptative response/methylated-DNA-[protein]-cysteine methyltransferase
MDDQQYRRIADAIAYLTEHADEQPSLDDAAERAGLSAFHFQRIFRSYAGVTPKQFLAHLTVQNAKQLLDANASVLDASLDVGLSSPARLHDHFVSIEAVTPGEYKTGGAELAIRYGFAPTPFGTAFIAQTTRGICAFAFIDDSGDEEFAALATDWPNAKLIRDDASAREIAERTFARHENEQPLRVLVKGTNWQVRVWRALLDIPEGTITNYGAIAKSLDKPGASRAVGSAIGKNAVGVLIPCHRVITANGALGGYRWGPPRKRALLAWEAARTETVTA